MLEAYKELRRIQDAFSETTGEEGAEDLIKAVGLMIANHFSSGIYSEARALFPASIFEKARENADTQAEIVADTQEESVEEETVDFLEFYHLFSSFFKKEISI